MILPTGCKQLCEGGGAATYTEQCSILGGVLCFDVAAYSHGHLTHTVASDHLESVSISCPQLTTLNNLNCAEF